MVLHLQTKARAASRMSMTAVGGALSAMLEKEKIRVADDLAKAWDSLGIDDDTHSLDTLTQQQERLASWASKDVIALLQTEAGVENLTGMLPLLLSPPQVTEGIALLEGLHIEPASKRQRL